MEKISKAEKVFELERDIPYRIVRSGECDCSGKHTRLQKAFEALGYEVRRRICWFKWSELPIPADVLKLDHDDDGTHLFLEVRNEQDEWELVDASWDSGLEQVLPVNTWREEMKIAVPCRKLLSPEESEEYMQSLEEDKIDEHWKKNELFFLALNEWLESVRIG